MSIDLTVDGIVVCSADMLAEQIGNFATDHYQADWVAFWANPQSQVGRHLKRCLEIHNLSEADQLGARAIGWVLSREGGISRQRWHWEQALTLTSP
jgi:hypothetical protein